MEFPGRDRKPLKKDAAEQTNRMLSAVIMRGNLVLSKSLDLITIVCWPLCWMYMLCCCYWTGSLASEGASEFFLFSAITCAHWSHVSHFILCLMKLKVSIGSLMENSCISPGVTPEVSQPAGFICFLFKLIKWLGNVHNWLSPSTSLESPGCKKTLAQMTFL